LRLRLAVKHDLLNATSTLQYDNNAGDYNPYSANHTLEYAFNIPLAQYLFDNDFIKTTAFTLSPKVGYSWVSSNGVHKTSDNGTAVLYAGVNLSTAHTLPLNFWIEVNVYAGFYAANDRIFDNYISKADGYASEGKKNEFAVYVEAYLKNTTKLVEFDKGTLSFYFEGGFDPYLWSKGKRLVDSTPLNSTYLYDDESFYDHTNSTYSVYAFPALQFDVQVADNITWTTYAGAEFRNIFTKSSEAQGWVWQPRVQTGVTIKF